MAALHQRRGPQQWSQFQRNVDQKFLGNLREITLANNETVMKEMERRWVARRN
jgi:hypothetical protein